MHITLYVLVSCHVTHHRSTTWSLLCRSSVHHFLIFQYFGDVKMKPRLPFIFFYLRRWSRKACVRCTVALVENKYCFIWSVTHIIYKTLLIEDTQKDCSVWYQERKFSFKKNSFHSVPFINCLLTKFVMRQALVQTPERVNGRWQKNTPSWE